MRVIYKNPFAGRHTLFHTARSIQVKEAIRNPIRANGISHRTPDDRANFFYLKTFEKVAKNTYFMMLTRSKHKYKLG